MFIGATALSLVLRLPPRRDIRVSLEWLLKYRQVSATGTTCTVNLESGFFTNNGSSARATEYVQSPYVQR